VPKCTTCPFDYDCNECQFDIAFLGNEQLNELDAVLEYEAVWEAKEQINYKKTKRDKALRKMLLKEDR